MGPGSYPSRRHSLSRVLNSLTVYVALSFATVQAEISRDRITTMAYTSVPSDNPPDYIQSAREHGIRLRQSAPVKKGPLPFELPIISHLKGKRVILASASPRRKALLAQVSQTNYLPG